MFGFGRDGREAPERRAGRAVVGRAGALDEDLVDPGLRVGAPVPADRDRVEVRGAVGVFDRSAGGRRAVDEHIGRRRGGVADVVDRDQRVLVTHAVGRDGVGRSVVRQRDRMRARPAAGRAAAGRRRLRIGPGEREARHAGAAVGVVGLGDVHGQRARVRADRDHAAARRRRVLRDRVAGGRGAEPGVVRRQDRLAGGRACARAVEVDGELVRVLARRSVPGAPVRSQVGERVAGDTGLGVGRVVRVDRERAVRRRAEEERRAAHERVARREAGERNGRRRRRRGVDLHCLRDRRGVADVVLTGEREQVALAGRDGLARRAGGRGRGAERAAAVAHQGRGLDREDGRGDAGSTSVRVVCMAAERDRGAAVEISVATVHAQGAAGRRARVGGDSEARVRRGVGAGVVRRVDAIGRRPGGRVVERRSHLVPRSDVPVRLPTAVAGRCRSGCRLRSLAPLALTV